MSDAGGMKGLCDFYIRRARTIGVFYCAVPSLIWFAWALLSYEFRGVYAIRLAVALVAGGWIAANLNRFGLSLWLARHRSAEGPATILDGALVGAAVGIGSAVLPALTSLIRSNHPEQAKTLIIGAWLAALVLGAVIGAALASVGRVHVERGEPAAGEQAP